MAVTHISINPADVLLSRSMSESTSVRDSNVIKSHTSILIFEPIENSASVWAARAEKKSDLSSFLCFKYFQLERVSMMEFALSCFYGNTEGYLRERLTVV